MKLNLAALRRVLASEEVPTVAQIAESTGVSQEAIRTARDVIYLLDEEGLHTEELNSVLEAVRLVSDLRLKDARVLVDPIMDKYFGDRTGSSLEPMAARELARKKFMSGIMKMSDTVAMVCGFEVIPFFWRDDRKTILAEIEHSISNLEGLAVSIRTSQGEV